MTAAEDHAREVVKDTLGIDLAASVVPVMRAVTVQSPSRGWRSVVPGDDLYVVGQNNASKGRMEWLVKAWRREDDGDSVLLARCATEAEATARMAEIIKAMAGWAVMGPEGWVQ